MSVYSSLNVYPSEADSVFECEGMFCEECTFDCWRQEDD